MVDNHSESFYYDLALKWAPVNYQYINLSDRNNHYLTKRDLIVPVNLECYRTKTQNNSPQNSEDIENCWKTDDIRNRLKALDVSVLKPVAYYSVAETKNHYFILYSFYHADDTTHPNDMEGCLVILEKIGDDKQLLLGMMTVAHFDFWKYVYDKNLYLKKRSIHSKACEMVVDEEIDSQRPLIQQEAGKHGLYALGDKIFFGTKIWRWFLALLDRYPDIVVYYPGRKASCYDVKALTKYRKTPHYPALYYELVNILDPQNGLWQRKTSTKHSTFQEDGKFHAGKANPPWLWTESEFENPRLNIWESPAELAMKWFEHVEGRKPFDTHYVRCMDGRMNCKCSDQQNSES